MDILLEYMDNGYSPGRYVYPSMKTFIEYHSSRRYGYFLGYKHSLLEFSQMIWISKTIFSRNYKYLLRRYDAS